MSERFFPDSMPPPLVDGTTLPWWQAAAEHRLVVQECSQCSHTQFPPSPICSECHSPERGWRALSGLGKVYTYTVVYRPIAAGQTLPFIVAVISLEGSGGVRLISNLVKVSPEDIEIGMEVKVIWEDMSETLSIPRFERR